MTTYDAGSDAAVAARGFQDKRVEDLQKGDETLNLFDVVYTVSAKPKRLGITGESKWTGEQVRYYEVHLKAEGRRMDLHLWLADRKVRVRTPRAT